MTLNDYNKGDKALYLSGVKAGELKERERINALIGSGAWLGESLDDDIENLLNLIFVEDVNEWGNCSSCGTEQLKYEQFQGCLCSIICDVDRATEQRITDLIEAEAQICSGLGYYPGKDLLDAVVARIKGMNK
jgi:hypothetical protein